MAAENWYVAQQGKVYGPYLQTEIRRLFRDGKLQNKESYLCQDGGEEWIPLKKISWLGSELLLKSAEPNQLDAAEEAPENPSVPKFPVISAEAKPARSSSGSDYPRLRRYLFLLETVNLFVLYGTWIICGIVGVLNLANGIPQFVLGCLVLSLIAGLAYLGYLASCALIEFVYVILNIERNTRQLVERQQPPNS